MKVRSFTKSQFHKALTSTAIPTGSVVMVHSALIALGRIEGRPIDAIPEHIFEVLREHFGPKTTIVVPTFNFDFCQGMEFNRQYTPAQNMGAFSEYLRRRPEARRSPHPMQSLAAVGPLAKEITERDTDGAFDIGSSFDALIAVDAHLLMLGCGINAVSLAHWAEQHVGVPYRYWKEFCAPYRDGAWVGRRTYRMYVRDLSLEPSVELFKIGHILRRRSELRRFSLGAGTVESCGVRHFVSAAVQLLQQDRRALIRPNSPPTGRYDASA